MCLPLIKQSEIADQTEKEQQSEQCRLRSKVGRTRIHKSYSFIGHAEAVIDVLLLASSAMTFGLCTLALCLTSLNNPCSEN